MVVVVVWGWLRADALTGARTIFAGLDPDGGGIADHFLVFTMDADDVPLQFASVVYAAAQRDTLRPTKQLIVAAVNSAKRVPLPPIRVPPLTESELVELKAWAGKYDWALSYGSATERKDSYGGDSLYEVYYFVNLTKK
jgi:hypothetical protein